MGKCNNCVHGKTAFDDGMESTEGMTLLFDDSKSVLGNMYGTCTNGNLDTFVKWWKDGKGIPSSQTKDVPCYEPTELTKKTDDLLETMNKMLDIVKKSKK